VPEAETHHLMAHAFLLQNRAEAAIAEAAKAPSAHLAYAARIRGRAHMSLGDAAQAGAAFDEATAAGPNDSLVWSDVARYRRGTSDVAGAAAAADKAVQLDARNIEALTLRGELTRTQYGLAAALPWFDRALQIDANYLPALVERAATLGDLGRMKDMLAETRAILTIAPKNPVAFICRRCWRRGRRSSLSPARSTCAPTAPSTTSRRACCSQRDRLRDRQCEQAIQRLQKLVGSQPDNVKARRLLARRNGRWRRRRTIQTCGRSRPAGRRFLCADPDRQG
jgi:tetratricopeptide (TPR) repeat protein